MGITRPKYSDILKGSVVLIVLSGISWGVYASFNAWPSIVGTWRASTAALELFTFTRDGEFRVSSGNGDMSIGTYEQDGGYIKVHTTDVIDGGGEGRYDFTLKVEFLGNDKFATDGPIGTFIHKRSRIEFTRLSPEEAAKLRGSPEGSQQQTDSPIGLDG